MIQWCQTGHASSTETDKKLHILHWGWKRPHLETGLEIQVQKPHLPNGDWQMPYHLFWDSSEAIPPSFETDRHWSHTSFTETYTGHTSFNETDSQKPHLLHWHWQVQKSHPLHWDWQRMLLPTWPLRFERAGCRPALNKNCPIILFFGS